MEFLNSKYEENIKKLKLQYKSQLIENELQEFLEYKRILYLQYFQEAILERFGFIRNAAIIKHYNSEDDTTFFIHSSGGMFCMIPNYYSTFSGRKKEQTSEQQQHQPLYETEVDKSMRLDENKENIFEKRLLFKNNKHLNNSLSLTINRNSSRGGNYNLIKTLKRAHSMQLEFYELNKANIKSSLRCPKLNNLMSNQGTIRSSDSNTDNVLKPKIVNKNCSAENKIVIDERILIVKKQPFYAKNNLFVGFYWSWNFMLGKRLRSQYTGDELFQDNALADFKMFCSNQDGRLVSFYHDIIPKI